MMHFVLVDDERAHHGILQSKLAWACEQLKVNGEVALATEDWRQAVAYADQAAEGTVWFLDIELNDEINGIDLCRMIHEKNDGAYIVYVSAYQQYALECCRSHAFDFLLKPWTDQQLLDCLRAVQREQERIKNGSFLTVVLGTRLIHLRQENILYFSKDKMAITAHYAEGQQFTWRESMESVQQRVKAALFFQCHKSFLIGLRHIQEIRWAEDKVFMENGDSLPLSRRRAQEMRETIQAAGL